jgi:RNA ligase
MSQIMELQKYLVKHGLTKLAHEFNIKVNRHTDFTNLVCLKYSQRESPLNEKIVQQCRGIILDEVDNWSIVSYPFDKFFNHGEKSAAKIDWNTATVFEKLDGSLMTLYFYQGKWRVQSSAIADASGYVEEESFTFSELFWQIWHESGYQLPSDTTHCFMFEMLSPYNRVVVRQNQNTLILLGVRHLRTLAELDPHLWGEKYGWRVVQNLPFKTEAEILTSSRQIDPMKNEGYVVCDQFFKRIKIKSPQYVAIALLKSKLKSNSSDILLFERRLLEIINCNEGLEFLSYFPEWSQPYYELKTKYEEKIREIEGQYQQLQTIPSDKEFALSIKHLPYSGVLFALRRGHVSSVRESLAQIPISKLETLLG